MKIENIIVCGDIHADWKFLNTLINRKKPDIILVCGDYGYWPILDRRTNRSYSNVRPKDTKIYWCDGNHEDHESLGKLREKEISEIVPNVFYMKRGSTLILPDGRVVLFMGGADSVDKEWRTPGLDWFPGETISNKDIDNLPEVGVDIVVSHTCPEFLVRHFIKKGVFDEKFNDPSQKVLTHVWEKYVPRLWYFGHFHTNMVVENGYTKFICLNCAGSSGRWWTYLPGKD